MIILPFSKTFYDVCISYMYVTHPLFISLKNKQIFIPIFFFFITTKIYWKRHAQSLPYTDASSFRRCQGQTLTWLVRDWYVFQRLSCVLILLKYFISTVSESKIFSNNFWRNSYLFTFWRKVFSTFLVFLICVPISAN